MAACLAGDSVVAALSVQQRHDGAEGCVQAGERVSKGDIGAHRRSVGVAVEVAQAAICLAHAGVTCQAGLGPRLTVSRDSGVDQLRLKILQQNNGVRYRHQEDICSGTSFAWPPEMQAMSSIPRCWETKLKDCGGAFQPCSCLNAAGKRQRL